MKSNSPYYTIENLAWKDYHFINTAKHDHWALVVGLSSDLTIQ